MFEVLIYRNDKNFEESVIKMAEKKQHEFEQKYRLLSRNIN